MIRDVPISRAELSSLATALDELTHRIGALAEQAHADDHVDAPELFAVERALRGANRRLGRLATSP